VIDWQQLAAIVGVIGGCAIALKVLSKFVVQLYRKLQDMFGLKDMKTDLKLVGERLDQIMAEFLPNGGASLKDQMNRLECDMALANERQRARMLDTPEMIFETDEHGHCVWVNRTYANAVQRSLIDLLGYGWVNGIALKDRESVVSEWYKAVEEDREFEMEFDFQDAKGDHFPVTCRSYKMRDWRTGKAVGFLGRCDRIEKLH
jgi:PAS domain S-box-containing protein